MRYLGVVVALGCLATACGGERGTDLESGGNTATIAPASTPADRPTTTAAAAVSATTPGTTEPGRAPGPVDAVTSVGRSIEHALLPDDAFGLPWEPQWRRTDATTYDVGPNQTDCAAYWSLESLRATGTGQAMWWAEGGNANQYVSRADGGIDIDQLDGLGAACPRVTWNEGGSFSVEDLELDDGVGFRFVDGDGTQVTWIAVTAHDDLVAVLDIPLWAIDGVWIEFDATDLDALVTQMHERLVAAPVVDLVPPTTTLPATTTTVAPVVTDAPTTTTTVPLDELAMLLLDGDDYPDGITVDVVRRYTHGQPQDPAFVEACPAAASVDDIDGVLRWSRSADGPDEQFEQLAGRAESAEAASELVRRFAGFADCDISSTFGQEVQSTGGTIEIEGASTASELRITALDEAFSLAMIVIAVDDVVTIVSKERGLTDGATELAAIAELAAQRIVTRR